MLAGLANRRLLGKLNFLQFRQMRFSSRLMFILAGLANPRLPGKPKNLRFSSNAILVWFNVHAGRAWQPSAGRKPPKIAVFRQIQFLFRLMFMLTGLANRRLPGNLQLNCRFFVKCNSRLV